MCNMDLCLEDAYVPDEVESMELLKQENKILRMRIKHLEKLLSSSAKKEHKAMEVIIPANNQEDE